jgi:hypothetical protein
MIRRQEQHIARRAAHSAVPDGRDRGSATLEMAIATPFMLLIVALVVLAGRVAVAGNTITTVAGNAAREASLARNSGAAAATATGVARAALAAQAINCQGGGAVSVDVSGFGPASRGVPGQVVAVNIECVVPIADLGLPGAPGSRTLSERAVSPIDPNRSAGGAP